MKHTYSNHWWNVWGLIAIITLALQSCAKGDLYTPPVPNTIPDNNIVVVYENDVHCALKGYAKFYALRSEYQAQTPYVTTVSAGDFVQGGLVGTLTNGEGVIDIVNKVGYDYVVPGNHEFDYGIKQMNRLLKEKLQATVLSANFCHYPSGELVFQPYAIKAYGDVKVAYIGVTTNQTMTTASPIAFKDENGNKIYDFMNANLETQVSNMVEKARSEGAGYVVLISHLGDIEFPNSKNALDVIHATRGIDVVLDGHAHSVINDSLVTNIDGQMVHYTSTGSGFLNMGVLTIDTNGRISTKLVETSKYEKEDAEILALVEEVNKKVSEAGAFVIGHSDFSLPLLDENGKYLVRTQESALGNFVADSYMSLLDTDVALINGGGLRAPIKAGEITYNDIIAVTPFGNPLCTATLTGQQLLDGLESTYSLLPYESGSFVQIGGMRLTIDVSVKPQLVKDENNLFVSVVEGAPRRVSNLEIYNRQTHEYEPVDPAHTYTVASSQFILQNMGCSGAFRYAVSTGDLGSIDYDATVNYFRDKLNGQLPSRYSSTEGRITIKNTPNP